MRHDFPATGAEGVRPGPLYKLLTSVVVPRPIAWVTSVSAEGVDNLAPHSFFTVSCVDPPMVQFTSVGEKDTLRNVRATREFVVHLTPEGLFETVNATSTDYPPEISEIDALGLTREPATTVRPPRIAESPVAIECGLHAAIQLGDCTVVIGRVRHVAVDEDVLDLSDPRAPYADIRKLAPWARLGRDEWGLLGEIREIRRKSYGEVRED